MELKFYEWLRVARMRQGLTQMNVASSLRVSVAAVSAWERGENRVALELWQWFELSKLLQVLLAEIVERERTNE